MSKKAVVAGHICLDLTPIMTLPLNGLFKPGKLITIGEAKVHPGGCVANTGLAMRIMGADVRLIAKTGADSFGTIIREILSDFGADAKLIIDRNSSTSYSIVLAPPNADRMFLHHPGANDTFIGEDISDNEIDDSALFHFGYPPVMRKMYECEGAALAALFARIKHAGIATSLDFSSIDPESEAGAVNWERVIAALIPDVDFFLPSFEELLFMLDRTRYDDLLAQAAGGDISELLDVNRDVKPLAIKLLSMGAKVVMIKCGRPGIYLRCASDQNLSEVGKKLCLNTAAWADKEIFEPSYHVDQVLSGVGAGDTSIAAFLAAVLKEESPENCLRLATAAGACCVQSYDAISGLKPLNELQKMIDSGWEKV